MLRITILLPLLLFCSFLPLSQAQEAQEQQICRFGVPPWQKGRTFSDVRKTYQPLLEWLSKQTGCQFVPIGAENYDDLVKLLVTGKVHLVELGPVPYVLASQENPTIRPLLTTLIWNPEKTELSDSYFGYILTLKKYKDIKSVKDLKDQSFGFVDQKSTSGYVYPNALLREEGIHYKTFFGKTHFLGSHPNVTDAIAAESIIAGATWQPNLTEAINKHGDIFKILLKTPPIPNNCIVAHPSLPEAIQAQITQLLPTIDPALLEGTSMKGFVVRPDNFYDGIRKIVAQEQE